MSTQWLPLITVIISSAVALLTVWMGSRFASAQARHGKVWDRKAEAYSTILEALHRMRETFDTWLEDVFRGRDVDDETEKARRTEYQDACRLLKSRIAREAWLLPPDVQENLAQMDAEIGRRHETWFDHIDTGAAEVKKSISAVMRMAEADLLRRRKWWFQK
jgi:hypothetical protein